MPTANFRLDFRLDFRLGFSVVHEVPGRLRLRVPALRDPGLDAA